MKAAAFAILTIALTVGGCNSGPTPQQIVDAANEQKDANNDAALCEGLTTASKNGDLSMRAVFESTPEGIEYGGGVIKELVAAGGYRFTGGAMVGDFCYAHAEASGVQWGKQFDLAWRCPVKIISDNPAEPGKTVLELVDDRECDLATGRGAPRKREIWVEMIRR